MYEVKEPFWQFVDHWQTLIAALTAGILALGAAGWTVWATRAAAKRQVAAVQEQTRAAQRADSRRRANEAYAFHAMLVAATEAVIKDVAEAREIPGPPPPGQGGTHSTNAYVMRQRVKRAGFAELRTAFVRFGGPTLTDKFLQLDKEIEEFAGQWMPQSHSGPGGTVVPMPHLGVNAGIQDQLNRIEQQAKDLRYEAVRGTELCLKELEQLKDR
jgi:hypothetical protein